MNPYLRDIILRNREYEMERDEQRQGRGQGGSRGGRDRQFDMQMDGQRGGGSSGGRGSSGGGSQGGRGGSRGGSQGSRQGGSQGQGRGGQGGRSSGGGQGGGRSQGGGRDSAGYPYQGGMQGMMNPNMGMGENYSYYEDDEMDMGGPGSGRRMGSRNRRDRAFGAEGEFYYDYDGRHYEEQNEYDQMGLNHSEFKRWKGMLKNADGTRGEKFDMNQIMPIAKQMNIDYRRFNEEDLVMAVNMLYSDYCKIFGNDITKYVAMAKAFLEDDDFDGTGSEKLATYFHCIVNKED